MRRINEPDEQAKRLLPVYLTTVGTEFDQPPVNRPHGTRFHQFLRVEKGKGVLETPTESYSICEGDVVFTRKDAPVAYRADGEVFQTGWVTFDGSFAPSLLSYLRAEPYAVLKSPSVFSFIGRVERQARKGASHERLSAAAYELCVTFFEELQLCRQSPALQRAKEFMENHVSADLSVADVAEAAGISESLLFRLFHNEEHVTPVEFLRKIRIRRAQEMLVNPPHRSVGEIAALCGFTDPSYFCRVFRAQCGCTPVQYRNQYLQ